MAEELEFTLKNKIGQTISGKVYIPEDISEPKPVAIFSHGYASNYKRVEAHCIRFAEKGVPAITFDFRGGGEESKSDGTMGDMTIETEIIDLKCVIDFAKKLAITDHEKVYVMGESLGGLVSLLAATDKDVNVCGVALWYPALMIPEQSKKRLQDDIESFRGKPVSHWFDEVSASIDIYKKIKGFKKPVIMFWGDEDTVVPRECLERACKEMKNAKLEVLVGQGHRFDAATSEVVCDKCIEFIEAN